MDYNVFDKGCIVPTTSLIIQYLKVKFEVFSAAAVKCSVLWLLVDRFKFTQFRRSLLRTPWRWKQNVVLKLQYVCTIKHDVPFHKILTCVANISFCCSCIPTHSAFSIQISRWTSREVFVARSHDHCCSGKATMLSVFFPHCLISGTIFGGKKYWT
jgi:hypothetical protein